MSVKIRVSMNEGGSSRKVLMKMPIPLKMTEEFLVVEDKSLTTDNAKTRFHV